MNIDMLRMNIDMLCMNIGMLCMHVGIVSSINAIDMLEILCMLNLTQITPHSITVSTDSFVHVFHVRRCLLQYPQVTHGKCVTTFYSAIPTSNYWKMCDNFLFSV